MDGSVALAIICSYASPVRCIKSVGRDGLEVAGEMGSFAAAAVDVIGVC